MHYNLQNFQIISKKKLYMNDILNTKCWIQILTVIFLDNEKPKFSNNCKNELVWIRMEWWVSRPSKVLF